MNSPEKQNDQDMPEPKNSQEFSGVYMSPQIFKGLSEITICHNGETYRLRQTRTGKLILNK